MHLWIHSDAYYLSESKALSRNCDFFYLSDKPKLLIKPNDLRPKLNAPVLVNRKTINTVMSSVQESETGSGFINSKYTVALRNVLHEMGHIQGPTPIQFEKVSVNGIITDTVVQHRSKDMDMRFYWLCDRCRQKTILCSSETSKTQSCRLSIKQSLHKTSHFSLTYLCTQYYPKTNKNSI